MSKKPLSTIFVSHGASTILFEDIPATNFLKTLGSRYNDFYVVLCISAHWETEIHTINSVNINETIHDFYGFQPELYNIKYPAKGTPELAEFTCEQIKKEGISCVLDLSRGLDLVVWIPMMLMFLDGKIPVFQLSIQLNLDPRKYLALGRALSTLKDQKILTFHPLGYANLRPGAKTDQWATDLNDWLTNAVLNGNTDELINFNVRSPYLERAHPYPDHFMPLLTSIGAAGKDAEGNLLHHSWYWGDLGMDAYEFNVE
jgi:4,5-DOPA dioxygenase extradiol